MSSLAVGPSGYGRNYDYVQPMQGRMARQQLARICMDARALYNTIDDNDRLPAWVMKKVATAEDRLHMAADYIRYKANPTLQAYEYGANDPYIGLPDGRMIKNTLIGIERDAAYLASVIGDNDRVATWAPKFIYTAQDRLNVVTEYYRSLARQSAYAGTKEDKEADASPFKFALYAIAGFALLSMLTSGSNGERY